MTNPTLERAARAALTACNQSAAYVDMDGDLSCATVDGLVDFYEIARAVLMAVLPELPRHGDEGYVYYDDLTAILAEGE